ncbi:MAG: DUF488 domain-containing protein, partial [Clostridiales bacterium]|nr:DUF488 domain-containing protein [Clostridiales bacterium]
MIIYTIGHSAHEISEFIAFLKSFKIQMLADVRSIPGSRYAPQYNEENLEKSLKESGIKYLRIPRLGGRRKSSRLEDYALVAGWKNKSFKNYAAYALTDEYEKGIAELLSLAEKNAVCIM